MVLTCEQKEEKGSEIIEQSIYELSSKLMNDLKISESEAIKYINSVLYLPNDSSALAYLDE